MAGGGGVNNTVMQILFHFEASRGHKSAQLRINLQVEDIGIGLLLVCESKKSQD